VPTGWLTPLCSGSGWSRHQSAGTLLTWEDVDGLLGRWLWTYIRLLRIWSACGSWLYIPGTTMSPLLSYTISTLVPHVQLHPPVRGHSFTKKLDSQKRISAALVPGAVQCNPPLLLRVECGSRMKKRSAQMTSIPTWYTWTDMAESLRGPSPCQSTTHWPGLCMARRWMNGWTCKKILYFSE
jgi:hypothetical protein